jgi:hypothetical protein
MSREVTSDECLRVSPEPNEFLRAIGEKPLDEADGYGEKGARMTAMAGGRR